MPVINLKSSNEEIVNTFFKDITCDDYQESIFKGGQSFADKALNNLDINGYAKKRNNVYPTEKRGSSYLSPYIRHGLLSIKTKLNLEMSFYGKNFLGICMPSLEARTRNF